LTELNQALIAKVDLHTQVIREKDVTIQVRLKIDFYFILYFKAIY